MSGAEATQEEVKAVRKRAKPKVKILYGGRAPSRQFNDPLYADLASYEQEAETTHWGPWAQGGSLPIPTKSILNLRKQSGPFAENPISRSTSEQKPLAIKPVFVRNNQDLPIIKQRSPSTLKQINFRLNNNIDEQSSPHKRKKQYQIRSLHKLSSLHKSPSMPAASSTNRVGRVVYNYCCQSNFDECLLTDGRYGEWKQSQLKARLLSDKLRLVERIKGNLYIKK